MSSQQAEADQRVAIGDLLRGIQLTQLPRDLPMSSATETLPVAGRHYSMGLRAGDFVFTAGQTPRNQNRDVVRGTIEEQTAAMLENVRRMLSRFDAMLDHVVEAAVHSVACAAHFNATYSRYFPNRKPVRTLVGSQLNGALVEINVVAFLGKIENMPHAG
jgi:2-iminobutanoate/2-iminopropanoate deaminase